MEKVYCNGCGYFINAPVGEYCFNVKAGKTWRDTPKGKEICFGNYMEFNKENKCKYYEKYKGDKFYKEDEEFEKRFMEWYNL